MFRRMLIGLQCTFLILFGYSVRSAELAWDGGGIVDLYDTSDNWDPDQVPTDADNLTFGLNTTTTVILGAPSNGNNITVSDGNWSFTGGNSTSIDSEGIVTVDDPTGTSLANGASATLVGPSSWNNAGDAIVGDAGYGSLAINSGGDFEADQILVGNQMDGVGEVTATGTGTTITAARAENTGIFTIGKDGGEGTINIEAGAQMLTTTTGGNDIWVGSGFFDADPGDPLNPIVRSVGTLNVDGVGSFAETDDLNIGIFGGIGFLNVTSGATIVLTDTGGDDANFGANDGAGGEKSTGKGVIDGDGSLLHARRIQVGANGSGSLEVSNGGEVRSQTTANTGNVIIGNSAGSDGVMAVYGTATDGTTASRLDVDDSLFVGNLGLGELRVGQDLTSTADGSGDLQVDVDLRIGDDISSTGDNKVIVDGANATANVGNVTYVGNEGKATLEVTGGAQFTSRFLRVGHTATGNGTLLIDGPNSLFDTVANGPGATSDNTIIGTNGDATATLSNGGRLNTDSLWVGYSGSSDGSLLIDNATVNVGADGGDLFIGGRTDVANAGGMGSVTVQNGGLLTASDEATIGGNGTGDGTLTIRGATSQFIVGEATATTVSDTLRVGSTGQGLLDIGDGGSVITEALSVTEVLNGDGGEIILGSEAAPGGTLEVRGHARIGDADAGTMTVSHGATFTTSTGVANQVAIIGDNTQSGGSLLTIDNAIWNHMGGGRIDVGNFSNGTRSKLEVKNGGTVTGSTTMFVANQPGATGELVVDGVGSSITGLTRLAMGDNGDGLMTIQAGGEVATNPTGFIEIAAFTGGVGVATVTGSGSKLTAGDFLSVGDEGTANGTLMVENGGTVTTTTGHGFIGRSGASSIGTVTVQDLDLQDGTSGSLLDSGGSLFVGGRVGTQGGTGFLNVNAGGTVSVTGELVVYNTGTLTLDGGTIETADFSVVSPPDFNFNTGTLRFTGDKTLGTTALKEIFGDIPNPTLAANQHLDINGAATISNALRLNGGTLSIGTASQASLQNVDWDAGTLNITAQSLSVSPTGQLGESVIVNQIQNLNVVSTGSNNITVDSGADLNVIRGGLTAPRISNNGLMVISNTAAVDVDSDNIGSGLTNNGDLVLINSTVAGGIVNNGRIEIVGPSTLLDSLTLNSGGTLGIDLHGLLDFDSIIVGGDATLDGLLDVSLSGGFSPIAGQQYTVLSAGSIFDNGLVLGGSAASQFDLLVSGTEVTLQAISAADVDLDNDGDVDGADFLALQRTNPALIPDWESQYGSGLPLIATSAAVPEPTSLLLLAVGCTLVAFARRNKFIA